MPEFAVFTIIFNMASSTGRADIWTHENIKQIKIVKRDINAMKQTNMQVQDSQKMWYPKRWICMT